MGQGDDHARGLDYGAVRCTRCGVPWVAHTPECPGHPDMPAEYRRRRGARPADLAQQGWVQFVGIVAQAARSLGAEGREATPARVAAELPYRANENRVAAALALLREQGLLGEGRAGRARAEPRRAGPLAIHAAAQADDEALRREGGGMTAARVFLLLEACGYEGFFICGVFTTREQAERARLAECAREKKEPATDRIYQVNEMIIDAHIPHDVRHSRGF